MAERAPIIFNDSAGQLQEVSLSDETSVGILSSRILSTISYITNESVSMSSTNFNYLSIGPVVIGTAGTVIVGSGVSYVIY
jgi:hypothetical protein